MRLGLSPAGVQGILLDIEGTTTPLAFVHEVLFPYAREHLKDYLAENLNSEELQSDLRMLVKENADDTLQSDVQPLVLDGPVNRKIGSIVAYVFWLMERDRKSTGLKSLQGKIWEDGYRRGTLKAPIFADVPPALERWQKGGLKTSIFSSGSVLAQKLLFAHTEAGDLTEFIDGYFDTTSGSKMESESYRVIAGKLDLSAANVLFISDVTAELDAAGTAGMHTLLCVRPGNHPPPSKHQHQTIQSFDEIEN